MVLELEASSAQVQRILQSKTFRTSEVHRNLLTYLAEKSLAGESDSLKEYTVGLDVFAKPSSYDPRQESVVRMHMARLRQKLTEYYRTEGIEDPIVADVPKGGFTMTFEPRQAPLVPPAEPVQPAVPVYRREMWLAVALVAALACASYFGIQLWRIERAPAASGAAWTPDLLQLWTPILSSNRPLMVVLATPLFARVPGLGFVRDSSSNDTNDLSKSKSLTSLRDALHLGSVIAPSYGFTEVGTANGAFLLGQFLAQRKTNVLLTRTDLVSLPDVAMADVVFLGQAAGNREIQAIPVDQQFTLEPGGIRNLRPRPGEPAFVSDRSPQDPRELEESYALISHVPGLYGNGEILYLSANQIPGVTAAVKAFTDPALARTLVSKLKTTSGDVPHYYQIVLKVRSMDDMPVEISYLYHRELSISSNPLP